MAVRILGRKHAPLQPGDTFNMLTVLRDGPRARFRARMLVCRCTCGGETLLAERDLRSGHIRSCGCLRRRRGADNPCTTHGATGTDEWKIWKDMRRRCNDPDNQAYQNYGGRGIFVCDRWNKSFEAFLEDMGPRPSKKHSLERRHNAGPYSPENVFWATRKEQSRNTRRNRNVTIDGVTRCFTEWAELNGIPARTAWTRIRRGWSDTDAVTMPPQR